MDLLAFISGACVALVAVFAAAKYRSRLASRPYFTEELNRIQACLTALAQPPSRTTQFQEKRADLIAALYARLVSLQRHLHEAHVLQTSEGRLYFGGREASERDIEQKLEREKAALIEDAQKLGEFVATQRIYFDSTMLGQIDALLISLQRMIGQSLTAGWLSRRGSGAPLLEISSEVTASLVRIEATFKALIGIDEPASSGDKPR